MAEEIIPTSEDARKSWGENMILKFPPLFAALGFTDEEQKAFLDDVRMMIYLITASQSAAAEAKAQTAYKKQMMNGVADGGNALPLPVLTLVTPPGVITEPGVIPRIRANVQRIKAHPGYTNAIGEQLQIVGTTAPAPNLQDAKPTFKALAKVASVILDWVKGKFDGVVIESKRGTETVFMFLDKDFKSPFEDTRPNLVAGQPEVRRYRMLYLLNDEPVGIWSDEVVITTMA